MDYATFTQHFREDQEIGRDIIGENLIIFRDNGTEVGVWRENRRTTVGQGEILSEPNTYLARLWCDQVARCKSSRLT
jgi:hypothetical protein